MALLAVLIPAAVGLLSPFAYLRELFGLLLIPVGLVLVLNILHSVEKRWLGRRRGSEAPGPSGYETIVEKHARGLFY